MENDDLPMFMKLAEITTTTNNKQNGDKHSKEKKGFIRSLLCGSSCIKDSEMTMDSKTPQTSPSLFHEPFRTDEDVYDPLDYMYWHKYHHQQDTKPKKETRGEERDGP